MTYPMAGRRLALPIVRGAGVLLVSGVLTACGGSTPSVAPTTTAPTTTVPAAAPSATPVRTTTVAPATTSTSTEHPTTTTTTPSAPPALPPLASARDVLCRVNEGSGTVYVYITSAVQHKFDACAGGQRLPDQDLQSAVLAGGSTVDRRCVSSNDDVRACDYLRLPESGVLSVAGLNV